MSMSADIALVRNANSAEFKSYVPEDNAPTEEQIAEARADEVNKFNRLDEALNLPGDDDLGEPEGDGLTTTSSPEKIFQEGRAAARAAAERAAAAAPKRAADGTFAPEADDLALPETPVTGDADDAALRRAELRLALVRSGFDDDQIADMEKKGTFEAKALKRQAALKADDEAHAFLREQRRAADGNGKTQDQPAARKAVDLEPLNVEPLVKPLAATLGLDEAGASTLKQSLEGLAKAVAERAEKQIRAGLDGASEAQAAQAGQQVFVDAQVEVGKRIPDLLDPTKFGQALKFAASMIADSREDPAHPVNHQLARFATPREKAAFLLETFANVSGFKVKPSGAQVQAEGERILRAHARSTVGDRTRTAPLTEREHDIHAYNDSMAKHGL